MFNHLKRWNRSLKVGLAPVLILLTVITLFIFPQIARAWYRELVLVWTSPESEDTQDVAWGDYDSDGDLDLVLGTGNVDFWTAGTSRVYANEGGTFTEVWSEDIAWTSSVDWGDWDDDGDLDLAIGNNFGNPNEVYMNTGATFSHAWTSPETDYTRSVAWGDINGDGLVDLAVGNDGQPNRVYTSTGSTLVLAWTAPFTESTYSVAWADYDGDDDLDLAVGNVGEANRVYENDGGALTLAWTSPEVEDTCGVAWADIDDNGYPDLAVANGCEGGPADLPDARVYANAGGNLILAWTSTESGDHTTDVAWGDWDSDGDPDLVVTANRGYVYANDGSGSLTLAWTLEGSYISADWGDYDGDGDDDLAVGEEGGGGGGYIYASGGGGLDSAWSADDQTTDDSHALAWGDWDNDGHLDLAVGNDGQPLRIYTYADGAASLAWSSSLADPVHSVAWGDWDKDGDLDLAVGNDGAPNRVYMNSVGSLSLTWSAPLTASTQSVAWGDWDEDGDLDLAVGNDGAPNRVYANDGGNSLSLAWTAPLTDATQSVSWGDWDDDGDLDLAAGNDGDPNRVYTNTVGGLSLAWSAPVISTTYSVAWGDYDGDGIVDLAVGNYAQPNQVYTSTGGGLSLAWTSPEVDFTHQVAWADWDGDGDLDLAAGNFGNPNRVYANTGDTLFAAWASPDLNGTQSVAWGDWDGDGDLDLAVGNWHFHPLQVYANGSERLTLAWSSIQTDITMDVAWGDWDGDGDLDLAVANYEGPNRVYENVAGRLTLAWTSIKSEASTSVAWGDWDGDGDLDLAVGNGTTNNYDPFTQVPNRVYENTGGALTLVWSSPETDRTMDVAWGDWDGDGDLDLAVGNWPVHDGDWCYGENRVYANEGGTLTLAWTGPESEGRTSSIAWADWDGDGDLDLAVGNGGEADEGTYGESNEVYANDGGTLTPTWTSHLEYPTMSIDWADWDGDGDPDLAVGNLNRPNEVYLNTGGALTLTWSTIEGYHTPSLAWGDWDNDGDPDLVVVNAYGGSTYPSCLYANTGGDLALEWTFPHIDRTENIAWGDYDGDGDLDLAVGNGGFDYDVFPDPLPFNEPNRLYHNHSADIQVLPDTATRVRITTPGSDQADFFHSATILQGPTITVTYSLVDPESDPVRMIEAHYSTDGGAHWQPAVAAAGALTTDLAASPAGTEHTFAWNIYDSGFQGMSENTIFRIAAYQGLTGSGPFQTPFRAARTGPFRLRGSQVRVMSGTLPVENGIVYRLPAGSGGDYEPYRDLGDRILRTGPFGYLEGWGQIALNDRLVALAPVTATDSYALYYTNATPTLTGVEPYTVTELGVQTIVVSETHPLILLNLDVSLEWDARQDEQFLSQLDYDLRRTSEFLYDWTNGQVALGETTIFHDRQNWLDAHIRIYATNRMRPNAAQGGIASDVITDPVISTITYAPGQVHIGAVWNRYGDPSGALGEDWPRTLAHELGHFALFLDDNYLGFSETGLLIPIDSCDGTAMTDPYRDDFSEFHPEEGWLPGCEATLSHQITGRADWQTIETFYPWLSADPTNPGPSGLPLAVTELTFVAPVTPTTALDAPYFYLSQDGHAVQPGLSARAFLFQDDRITDLGRPTLDQVLARGASPGDRVCVYELDAERAGCETVRAGDDQLVLVDQPGWLPDVIVSPVTSRTVVISVTNAPIDIPFRARLYPLNDSATDPISLTLTGDVFSGTFHTDFPVLDGYLHVYVDEAAPRREVVTDFSIGGNPARLRGRWARLRGRWARLRGRWAPGVSADGQVILFGDLDFDVGEFFTLQAATRIPDPLPWATLVGHAYRLSASPNAPDLTAGSLSFMYAGSEVPAGEENFLRLYFWDGVEWRILLTELDFNHNTASCPIPGPGFYALMSSYEIPLYGPGWNNVSYPLQESRPVTQSFLSISGFYTTVYGYDATDTTDPWKVYDVTAPDWVNDLSVLEFGQGYWINVSETITWRLKGDSAASTLAGSGSQSGQGPPATYYGLVEGTGGFAPTAGLPVLAQVDGCLCGQSQTMEVNGKVVYSVNVFADGPGGAAGCGAPGREVTFEIGSQVMGTTAIWDNSRVWELMLSPTFQHRIYLPLVLR